MRIWIRLELSEPNLPIIYRKIILSWLKEWIKRGDPDRYAHYFATSQVIKPYTFHAYLPIDLEKKTPDHLWLTRPHIDVTFSTSDYGDIAAIHNGLMSDPQFVLSYKSIVTAKVLASRLMPDPVIQSGQLWKTLSPIVLRYPQEAKQKKSYISIEDVGPAEFNTALNRSLAKLANSVGHSAVSTIELIPEPGFKSIAIPHSDSDSGPAGVIVGHKGRFKLNGAPEIIRLMANAGIGDRRGYGFGMVDIV